MKYRAEAMVSGITACWKVLLTGQMQHSEGKNYNPTVFLKAAAILESVIKNRPFIDGNKRTGWLACIAVMRLHERKFTLTEDEAYDFVIRVASSHLELEDIALFIELQSAPI